MDEERGDGPLDDGFDDPPADERVIAGDGELDDEKRGRGLWILIGALLVMLGLCAGAAAVYTRSSDDDDEARRSGTSATATTTTEAAPGTGDAPTTTIDGAAPTKEARWPVAVGGRPAAFGVDGDPPPAETDLADGFYLWLDFSGWHLWLVGGVDADANVDIRSDDAFAAADPTGGEPDLLQDRNGLIFARGNAEERVVGVDFNPGFYGRTMVITTTGDLPIHLGAQSVVGAEYLGLQESTAN
ncbi:hypothetical protein ACE2AJ_12395 [Aquihabitans daechungensis]|uniref:hypothetical protein n=1 Tax=Aquihabitans daechungensis TaxID=1052257 RepID=UPI003BA06110